MNTTAVGLLAKYFLMSPGDRLLTGIGIGAGIGLGVGVGRWAFDKKTDVPDVVESTAIGGLVSPLAEAALLGYGSAGIRYAGAQNIEGLVGHENANIIRALGIDIDTKISKKDAFDLGSKQTYEYLKSEVSDVSDSTVGKWVTNRIPDVNIKGSINEALGLAAKDGTKLTAEESAEHFMKTLSKSKFAVLGIAGVIGTAAVVDFAQDAKHERNADNAKAQQKKQAQRKMNKDKDKYTGYGLPQPKSSLQNVWDQAGLTQDIWDSRIGHYKVANAKF